ncbi:hypothetical protein [Polycladidibacter stylochi]|uniref:hypothetical protein n=1 Tax=Polycladidibacter stylochi TaxID=1807766 RepID=UPI00138F701D|nr:hypothetical protein [Pseudovibrio stylochi]
MVYWAVFESEATLPPLGISENMWPMVAVFAFMMPSLLYKEHKLRLKLPAVFILTTIGTIWVVFANALAVYLSLFFVQSESITALNILLDAIHIISIAPALFLGLWLGGKFEHWRHN